MTMKTRTTKLTREVFGRFIGVEIKGYIIHQFIQSLYAKPHWPSCIEKASMERLDLTFNKAFSAGGSSYSWLQNCSPNQKILASLERSFNLRTLGQTICYW